MTALTLVPRDLARPGHSFTFVGPNDGEECRDCPYRRLCFSLEPGHRYTVIAVREVVHPCNLHDEGRVQVVEVEEAPIRTSLEAKRVRGTAATWTPVPCGMPECPRYGFCHPVGPKAGTRHEIVRVGDRMDCPAGYDLHEVDLRPLGTTP